ncbi:uncharacterized protein LOC127278952 [Leptopilina boulardi]|nr:uncharacterized protein LOC127278952 [Leptopilina boulardi]XP_051156885.1 uncharacterized protein LOC127278952 [Leptopilina boulardi]
MGITTIQKLVQESMKILWKTLQPDVLKFPSTEEEWMKIIKDFDDLWQFPNCFGAMDGKHIMMQAQPNTGSDCYNYKEFHSIILLAMCDATYNFTYVDVGGKGRQSDSGVLKNTDLYEKLANDSLNLPPASFLHDNGPRVPQVFLGDAAFSNTDYCLCPFKGAGKGNLEKDKMIFNYRREEQLRMRLEY